MKDSVHGQPLVFAWAGVTISIFLCLCALYFASSSGSSMFAGAALASGLALAYSLIAAGQGHFARRVSQEEENVREQQGQFNHSELFSDSADDALQLARRVYHNYIIYAVPALALAAALLVGGLALVYWRYFDYRVMATTIQEPFSFAVISLGLFVLAVLCGSYYVGKSRETLCRWLRPVGAVWLLTGLFFAVAGVVLIAIQWQPEYLVWDYYVGKALLALIMVLSVEAGVTVIIDFYRPRIPGEELKPVYESRVLTVFTEPGGIARNIALSLDYQFGFEVSEARFYRFLERTLIPLCIFMVFGLWLMTCFVVIDVDERGIRERFGRVVAGREEALEPGLYFKLPLPFERIHTYPTAKMQTIPIGYVPADGEYGDMDPDMMEVEMGDPTGRVIVWSKAHNIEETNFVVASGPDADLPEPVLPEAGPRPVPVYFMAASIPLYYRVDDLYTYLYLHSDARQKLEKLATREVVAYMATVDFFEILTAKRGESGEILKDRIQAAADSRNLGVKIAFVGLEGLHPPVRVGSAFDEVVSASEEKHTQILRARQYRINRNPQARAEGFRLEAEAEMYRLERSSLAHAEGERFMSQLIAFQAAPELFPLRAYLDVLENEGKGVRNYVVGLPHAAQVMILNLEEKLRPDLLDLDLGSVAD